MRVLIVRTSAMGDVLHALPAVAALRRLHPDWHIGWVIDPRWLPLLQTEDGTTGATGCRARPIVDRVHLVPTQAWKHRPLALATARGIAAIRRELRAEHYDLCVDMQGLIRSAIVGSLSASRRYVGRLHPRESVAGWFYEVKIETPAAHVIDKGCELLGAAIGEGLTAGDVALPMDAAAERWAEEFLERTLPRELHGRFVFVAPMAGWGAKQWPRDRYGKVAIALAEAGYATLVNAYGEDDPTARQVVAASLGCAVAAPSTMTQMIALERRAALVIAGDTGPLHLAAALRRPVVALYGPTDPARTGPYGTRSRVLRHAVSIVDHSRHEVTEPGLLQITTVEVVAAALDLLRESKAEEPR
jgi:heptosyltransferase-1